MSRLTLLSLALLSSACSGGASSSTFLSPTAPVAYTLSGVVTEMTPNGPMPIPGAAVAQTTRFRAQTTTDANGRYSMPGLSAASYTISVTSFGFVTETNTVTMNGDTQFDIRLERVESHILSGVVFEMTETGQLPIEGVEIYCDSCGSPDGHTFVHTNADGFYSLAWAIDGVIPLFVTKAGYEISDPTGKLRDQYGRISATVNGDTRFDVRLVRR